MRSIEFADYPNGRAPVKIMERLPDGVLESVEYFGIGEAEYLFLRIIAALLMGTWAVLFLMGKGGFIHILVLNGLGVAAVDVMTVLRSRMTTQ